MNVYRIDRFHALKHVILIVYKIEAWLLQKAAQKTSDPPGSLLETGQEAPSGTDLQEEIAPQARKF